MSKIQPGEIEMKNQSLGETKAAVRQSNALELQKERTGRMKERRYLERYAWELSRTDNDMTLQLEEDVYTSEQPTVLIKVTPHPDTIQGNRRALQ